MLEPYQATRSSELDLGPAVCAGRCATQVAPSRIEARQLPRGHSQLEQCAKRRSESHEGLKRGTSLLVGSLHLAK